jgi:lysophospholipase L1-like esterase
VDRSALHFAVLGDSLAFGTGALRPADALGPRLAAALERAGYAVELRVLAVPGAVSADLDAQVRRAIPLRPDLALIVIGANDLPRLVPPDRAAAALGMAVAALRAVGTSVIATPAPDLSAVPGVPPALRPVVQGACRLLQQRQAAAAAAAGAVLAPVTTSLARAFADPALYSTDRYHPSSLGYARIASALEPVVVAAARSRVGPADEAG